MDPNLLLTTFNSSRTLVTHAAVCCLDRQPTGSTMQMELSSLCLSRSYQRQCHLRLPRPKPWSSPFIPESPGSPAPPLRPSGSRMRLQCKEGGRWGRKEGGRRKERGEGEGVTERRMRGETTTHHYLLGFSPLPLLLPIILIGLYNPSYNPSYNPIILGSWVQSSYEACPTLPGWSSSCPRPELIGIPEGTMLPP